MPTLARTLYRWRGELEQSQSWRTYLFCVISIPYVQKETETRVPVLQIKELGRIARQKVPQK